MLHALLLAATLEINPTQICAKYRDMPFPAAASDFDDCLDSLCEVDLASQFANGDGVERDYDIATYFLCQAESSIAPAEFEGMYEHIESLRAGTTTETLSFCEHVTSGVGQARCAAQTFDEEMPLLEQRIAALLAKTNARKEFEGLHTAGLKYVDAEKERMSEQARGGTAYSAITIESELEETRKLVESLEKWSATRAPMASANDLKRADAELNDNYREERQVWVEEMGGEDGHWQTLFRDAQRAWIAYRDAFASYYAARWRGKAADALLKREILTQLTKDRANELGRP